MDERQYVNAIARRIKCNGKKKKEIKRQLLADITMRTEQGECNSTNAICFEP